MTPPSIAKEPWVLISAWWPRGLLAWLLTIWAVLLTVTVGIAAYYMLIPVNYEGAGKFGFLALLFSLQFLFVSALATALGSIAWRRRLPLPASLFAIVAGLTAVMAIWPSIAIWQRAKQYDVSLDPIAALLPRLHAKGPSADRTVRYAVTADGTQLLLDVWPAEGGGDGRPRPAIVRIHGGAWVGGARSALPEWNRWLNQLGYVVFDIDYRMPPPERWLDEVGDVKCAIGWVAEHAVDYGIDPARISTMGYSAGGNLAMLAAYSMGDPQLPPSCPAHAVKIRSVVNIYGPADMALGYRTTGSVGYLRDAMERYIGGSPDTYPDRYRILSPISHVDPATPPTIAVLGEKDRIIAVDQAGALAQAQEIGGSSGETYLIPASDHGFDVNWSSFASQIARAKIADFLRRHDE